MLKGVGKGKPEGKGKGRAKGKGKGKGSSAGVGSTYADPGRPKIFQPTEQDRSHTGNIAEHFLRAEKTTPQPSVPSTQVRSGRDARRPRASPAAGGTSTAHLDGNILPYFIVIKCSAPSGSNPHDFDSMRVIHNLHAEPAFSDRAGWRLKKWEGF
jgi:hypothetical protein